MADILEQQAASPFRVAAYRRAAETVSSLKQDITQIVHQQGLDGLIALPNIGRGIASAIDEVLRTGKWTQLERLRGVLEPVRLFQTVPGIGPELAQRIYDTLDVDTLEGLEVAAHDGRLETVPGVGLRRVAAIRATLDSMLARVGWRRRTHLDGPSVRVLLNVDQEYRERANVGRLPTIAPKRFNPSNEAWLPVLHTHRENWHFTALYSNTARAHELKRTRDWVVVYFYDDHHQEGQYTIVTETRGPLAGQRVVRGLEQRCDAFYAGSSPAETE